MKDESTVIGEDSSFFLCSCGAEFELYNLYKQHLLMGHKSQDLLGLPSSENSQQLAIRAVQTQQSRAGETNDDNGTIESEKSLQVKRGSLKLPMRDKDQRRQGVMKLYAKRFPRKGRIKQRGNTISWNGFTLKMNLDCQIEPFFCGNCEIIFFSIEAYIAHCIQVCQTGEHQNSSHFITFNFQQTLLFDKYSRVPEKYQTNSYCSSDLESQQQNKGLEIDDFAPLRQIIRNDLDHNHLPFYCCHVNFGTCQRYYQHFILMHQNKVAHSCSHAILKCLIGQNRKIYTLYLSQNVEWTHSDPQYFCLCDKRKKISMKELIRHIINNHYGVSPLYCIPQETNLNSLHSKEDDRHIIEPKTMASKALKQKKSTKRIKDPIKYIYKGHFDHRDLPFYCGSCHRGLKSSSSYYKHILKSHPEFIFSSSSHIILRILGRFDKTLTLRFISPSVAWINNDPRYYCPCKPEEKVTMPMLVNHIIKEHQGISLFTTSPISIPHGLQIQYN